MSFFPFSVYFNSYLDKEQCVYFEKTLIHAYVEEETASVIAEYFSIEKIGSLNKLGVSQIQLPESMTFCHYSYFVLFY
jgi:hypothetical protein